MNGSGAVVVVEKKDARRVTAATRPNYLDETRVFGRWTMVQNTVERGRDKAAQSVQNSESYEEIGREDQNLPKRVIFLFAPSVLQTAVITDYLEGSTQSDDGSGLILRIKELHKARTNTGSPARTEYHWSKI
ncbi:hypothetical protein DFH09DRAFT_1098026 [Mycena vulgaris]|nr:hypothetical protein DFH09DRAFT_1098026 [Mycena vulgaris]